MTVPNHPAAANSATTVVGKLGGERRGVAGRDRFGVVAVMNEKRSDWHLPEEVLGLLSSIFLMPVVAGIAVLTAMLLPSVTSLRGVVVGILFWSGLATGVFGVVLLFFRLLGLIERV